MKHKLLVALSFAFAFPAPLFADQAATDLSSTLLPSETESQLQADLNTETSKIFGYDFLSDSAIQKILSVVSADDNNISVLEAGYDNLKAQNDDLTRRIAKFGLTPEACELDELKNVQASEAETESIRFNCVRQYILSQIPTAINVVGSGFPDATLAFHPTIQTTPVMQQYVEVTLQNTSSQQIIAADIYITSKATPTTTYIYRVYPDFPIDPNSVGSLDGETLLALDPSQNFGDVYSWGFVSVWAANDN